MKRRLIGLGDDGKLTLQLPDGQRRSIEPAPPGQALILLDCSKSMLGEPLEDAKTGVVKFLKQAFSKGYCVGLVVFASQASLVQSPTDDPAEIKATLSGILAQGTTNLAAALDIAADQLGPLPGTRVAVIATDGYPNDADAALAAARRTASTGVEIITIGTEDADQEFLASIATTKDLALSVTTAQLGAGIARAAGLLPARSGRIE